MPEKYNVLCRSAREVATILPFFSPVGSVSGRTQFLLTTPRCILYQQIKAPLSAHLASGRNGNRDTVSFRCPMVSFGFTSNPFPFALAYPSHPKGVFRASSNSIRIKLSDARNISGLLCLLDPNAVLLGDLKENC